MNRQAELFQTERIAATITVRAVALYLGAGVGDPSRHDEIPRYIIVSAFGRISTANSGLQQTNRLVRYSHAERARIQNLPILCRANPRRGSQVSVLRRMAGRTLSDKAGCEPRSSGRTATKSVSTESDAKRSISKCRHRDDYE